MPRGKKEEAPSTSGTSQEELLAELNGQGKVHAKVLSQKVTQLDPPEEPKPDPLQTATAAPLKTKTQEADELFSTPVGGKGYKVTVTGEYFAHSMEGGKNKLRKPYEITVNVGSLEKALGIIVGSLLTPALRRKYPDFSSFRTHEIAGAVPLSPETPETTHLQYMTRDKLIQHIAQLQAPIDPADYPTVVELREAVIDYTYNPQDFVKRQAKNLDRRKRVKELRALNPGLEVGTT